MIIASYSTVILMVPCQNQK